MNWLIFTIVTYVLLVLQRGLRMLFEVSVGNVEGIWPDFLFVLMVFVVMSARTNIALWASLALGLIVDLEFATLVMPSGERVGVAVLGAHVAGYLAAAGIIIQLRSLVFRNSPLTMGVMTFVGGMVAHVVIVVLYSTRGLSFMPGEPLENWDAATELFRRFFMVLYTVGFAVVLSFPLQMTYRMWGFDASKRHARRPS